MTVTDAVVEQQGRLETGMQHGDCVLDTCSKCAIAVDKYHWHSDSGKLSMRDGFTGIAANEPLSLRIKVMNRKFMMKNCKL